MTRVLVWKEVREQLAVVVALLALGSGVLVTAATLLDPASDGRATDYRSVMNAGRLGLLMLVMTAGVVVGGTLFAGERESGTLPFLDRLPGSRWRVLLGKGLAGAGLVLVAAVALFTVAAVAGLLGSADVLPGWAELTLVAAFAAYGWGMLGSVVSRSSLGACGLGLALATPTGVFLYAAAAVVLSVGRRQLNAAGLADYRTWDTATLVALWGLLAVPVPVAGFLYTAPDRARRRALVRGPASDGGPRPASTEGRGSLLGLRRLVWLSVRQLRLPAAVLGGVAVVGGAVMLPPAIVPAVLWPGLTLLLGVLAGVVGMADEQGSGAFRFWAERRLPAGRLWAAKVVAGSALTLALVLLAVVPLAVGLAAEGARGPFLASLFRTAVLAERGFPVGTFLLCWPAYGFAFGHLAGVLFRKPVVAGAVGLLSAAILAGFWLPSLVSGGVHPWQVFAPPAAAVATAGLLSWPWVTDRLGNRPALVRLAGGLAAVLLAAVGGIGYRVAEVPEAPEARADLAFSRELPTFDDQQAGRDLRRAVAKYQEVPADVRAESSDRPLGPRTPGDRPAKDSPERRFDAQVPKVLEHGYPAGRPDLDGWMDRAFATGWDGPVYESASKPTGVLEDPNELTVDSPLRHLDGVRGLGPLFLARGLQHQAAGRDDPFVDALWAWLAAVRTTRKDSPLVAVLVSRGMEQQAYQALDRWLERLDGRPDLLRAALDVVRGHDAADPFDPARVHLAHQTILRGAVASPGRWAPRYLDANRPGGAGRKGYLGEASPDAELQANLLSFAWAVPWEQERLRRAVGVGNDPARRAERDGYLRGLPGYEAMTWDDPRGWGALRTGHDAVLAARRAAVLKLAVRLFEAEAGRPPASLDEVVARGYLPAVPADPYDGGPFRYRVSAGEEIDRPSEPVEADPERPPGVGGPVFTGAEFTAAGGLIGGGACWPLEGGWFDGDETGSMTPPAAPLPGSPTRPDRDRVAVPAGRGVLWSVGPDKADGGGRKALDPARPGSAAGDLVYVVPPRPTPAAKP